MVLVPSPNVAEDHQTTNANALVNKKAAVLVKDVEAVQKMWKETLGLLDDKDKRNKMNKNLLAMAKPNADVEIAKIVLKVVAESQN